MASNSAMAAETVMAVAAPAVAAAATHGGGGLVSRPVGDKGFGLQALRAGGDFTGCSVMVSSRGFGSVPGAGRDLAGHNVGLPGGGRRGMGGMPTGGCLTGGCLHAGCGADFGDCGGGGAPTVGAV
jgi:hypothetical protein